jgi:soluble lytic murein transglycosylase-like protein
MRAPADPNPISRTSVATAIAAGLALLWLSAAPAPVALEVALPSVSAGPAHGPSDESSIAGVLARENPQLVEPELARIARAVLRYSAKYDLDPELVTAVILVESSALPSARSP